VTELTGLCFVVYSTFFTLKEKKKKKKKREGKGRHSLYQFMIELITDSQ